MMNLIPLTELKGGRCQWAEHPDLAVTREEPQRNRVKELQRPPNENFSSYLSEKIFFFFGVIVKSRSSDVPQGNGAELELNRSFNIYSEFICTACISSVGLFGAVFFFIFTLRIFTFYPHSCEANIRWVTSGLNKTLNFRMEKKKIFPKLSHFFWTNSCFGNSQHVLSAACFLEAVLLKASVSCCCGDFISVSCRKRKVW